MAETRSMKTTDRGLSLEDLRARVGTHLDADHAARHVIRKGSGPSRVSNPSLYRNTG